MATYTAEQILRIGGSEWRKSGRRRIYLDASVWQQLIGLEVSYYGTGNVSRAVFDGQPIPNRRAQDIINAVSAVYLDCADGRIHVITERASRYADDAASWIRTAIARQVEATEPQWPEILTPTEAADRLGVTVQTVYHRIAAGKLHARRIGRRWAITL